MKSPEMTIACELCGKEFKYVQRTNNRRRLCDECRRAKRSVLNDKYRGACRVHTETGIILAAVKESQYCGTSLRELKYMKRKPEGMSDVRWRMELRRRANEDYFESCGDAP